MRECTGFVVKGKSNPVLVFGTTVSGYVGVDLEDEVVVTCPREGANEFLPSLLTRHQRANMSKWLWYVVALEERIVTVSGKSRAGKDTFADSFSKHTRVTKLSLGDPIKQINKLVNGNTPNKNREFLIRVGQGMREIDPDIWVKSWLNRALGFMFKERDKFLFIVPDVRQPNELNFFSSLGARTIKITANEDKRLEMISKSEGVQDATNSKLLNDETESHVDGFDTEFYIHNDYSDHFYTGCQSVISELLDIKFA